MEYIVILKDSDGHEARLGCDSLKEAVRMRDAFINYGKYDAVLIEYDGEIIRS